MKNKTFIIAGAIILGFILLGVIANTGDKTKEQEMITVPHNEEVESGFEGDFIGGCVDEGATYSECKCMYDSLVRQVGFDGLVDMSVDYLKTEQMPIDVIMQAVEDCY